MAEDQYPQLHLDNQLCFSVYTLSRLITQAYQPMLQALGLTYPQYLVMLVLWQALEKGRSAAQGALPVTVKFLCEQLQLDTGTVTPLLKRMESNGLLVRRRSATDERVVEVDLTDTGKMLREQAKDIPTDILCQTGVDIEQGKALRDELKGLIRQLAAQRS
tara:strand:+ start:183 stop:665 length:483 start_codon:yes stop_codon:yes gene_type:complete